MNQEAHSPWPQHLSDGSMANMLTEDDFTSFLEPDNDFPALENVGDARSNLDTNMEGLDMEHLGLHTSTGEDISGAMSWETSASTMSLGNTSFTNAPTSMPMDAAGRPSQRMAPQALYHKQHMIPPTPTSDELHGGAAYYTSAGPYAHPGFEAHRYPGNDPASFTPLVSPAVTPLDLSFHMPEYTMPGEYFSPLTSPAIEAQNTRGKQRIRHSRNGSDAASPVDFQSQNPAFSAPPTPAAKKVRRKPNDNPRSGARSVGKSPMVKPQSRRKRGSANLSPVVAALIQNQQNKASAKISMPNAKDSSGLLSSESSGQDSVSPEPLTDALMPPPALPRSSGRSPPLAGKSKLTSPGNEPATPATLMKLPKNQGESPSMRETLTPSNVETEMEDLQLPEAAPSSVTAASGSGITSDDQTTPTMRAKTPNLNGQATPRARLASSSGPSPQIDPIMSPLEISQSPTFKGTTSRGGKKRQSTSSSQISPAIRPKISPSIKPLVPHGVNVAKTPISAETSALYLASKSNYQNILEGTHLPGVSYPEALAENLSSKRTSHKIAEQGRRNRINTALKEIEALLPTPPVTAKKGKGSQDEAENDKASAANQSSSKASTVEMAIVYIRDLQAQLAETQTKLNIAEKKLAETTDRESNDTVDPRSE